MFKDYDKFLSTSLKVYLFLLIIIFIMKIVGLDYFGFDMNNAVILKLDQFVNRFNLVNIYYFIMLYIYSIFFVSIVFDKNDKEMKIVALIFTIIGIGIKVLENKVADENINCAIDFIYLVGVVLLLNIKYKKPKIIRRTIIILVVNMIYQQMTFAIRSINFTEQNSFVLNAIINFDYILMLLITYNLYFMKGGIKLCGMEVGYSLQMKNHFTKWLKEFQKNYSNFKKLEKQEKATIIIYSILSMFWNIFTFVVVLFMAKLNDTFVECIFIITSFWLSKKVFGKPFHLKSMVQCFILSNITYYVLNRITTPTGISILIPIMLGVGLSYATSKLVKKKYKPLYKGMPVEVFEDTILKVVDKDSLKYKICYDFFIEKQNAIFLGHKYNYTEAGIRKITSRVNDDIKALNK